MTDGNATSKLEASLALISRGAQEIISLEDLKAKLQKSETTGIPLKIKLGLDPTAPDIHLGFAVVLRKLRQFQDLGHKIIIIIGDFTARIGDPTGRSETRKMLSEAEIAANALTYKEQFSRILDVDKLEIVFNSQWLGALNFADILKLTSHYTFARIFEREDFQKRYKNGHPIGLHEFLYPLMQGYDSVALKADLELGGIDQKLNILVGRELQREYGTSDPQVALLMPILEGLDGVHKMSKSLGNYVGIAEPPKQMFGKLMSVPDELIEKYLVLGTEMPMADITALKIQMQSGKLHPRDAKKIMARTIITLYHGAGLAQEAEAEFERVFHARQNPSEIESFSLFPSDLKAGKIWIVDLVAKSGLCDSKREARRIIAQGGLQLDGVKIASPDLDIAVKDGMILKAGSRRFAKLQLES